MIPFRDHTQSSTTRCSQFPSLQFSEPVCLISSTNVVTRSYSQREKGWNILLLIQKNHHTTDLPAVYILDNAGAERQCRLQCPNAVGYHLLLLQPAEPSPLKEEILITQKQPKILQEDEKIFYWCFLINRRINF